MFETCAVPPRLLCPNVQRPVANGNTCRVLICFWTKYDLINWFGRSHVGMVPIYAANSQEAIAENGR
jgi:hypothetical protein